VSIGTEREEIQQLSPLLYLMETGVFPIRCRKTQLGYLFNLPEAKQPRESLRVGFVILPSCSANQVVLPRVANDSPVDCLLQGASRPKCQWAFLKGHDLLVCLDLVDFISNGLATGLKRGRSPTVA
jgi:hypothetical protein